jgi:hypothetical protein
MALSSHVPKVSFRETSGPDGEGKDQCSPSVAGRPLSLEAV